MATILVVDDDPDILELMCHLLVRAGHTVCTAGSAEAALQGGGGRCDLAVIDVRLPQANGPALAQALRSQARRRAQPEPRLIACTAYFRASTLAPLGFDGYVPKPLDAEGFIAYIDAQLQTHAATQRAAGARTAPLTRRRVSPARPE